MFFLCAIACRPPSSHASRHPSPAAPRSGLAWKHFIDVGAGVIDEDYRGNVGVILFNHGEVDFPVKRGDRIAQLVLEKISTPEVVEVESLDETDRAAGGFGSTGGFASKEVLAEADGFPPGGVKRPLDENAAPAAPAPTAGL